MELDKDPSVFALVNLVTTVILPEKKDSLLISGKCI